jgi:hypothetical protein
MIPNVELLKDVAAVELDVLQLDLDVLQPFYKNVWLPVIVKCNV